MTLALTAKACLFMKNEAGLLTCNSWYHLPALAVAYLIQLNITYSCATVRDLHTIPY